MKNDPHCVLVMLVCLCPSEKTYVFRLARSGGKLQLYRSLEMYANVRKLTAKALRGNA